MKFFVRWLILAAALFSSASWASDAQEYCARAGLKCLKQHFSELEETDRFYTILDQASLEAAQCESVGKMKNFLTLVDFKDAGNNAEKNIAAYIGNLCADNAPCFRKASRMLNDPQRKQLEEMLKDSPSFANDNDALIQSKCLILHKLKDK